MTFEKFGTGSHYPDIDNHYNIAILIPFYNHHQAIQTTLELLSKYDLAIIIVNDGSEPSSGEFLEQHTSTLKSTIKILNHEYNMGKGAAVKTGMTWLAAQGYTHAMQIDADGQHEIHKLMNFIEMSKERPDVIFCGEPSFSDDIPKARFYGRYATHVWVWINTLSFRIKDSMCGFRLYPLKQMQSLLQRHSCGNRMEFDVEVLVRALWANFQIEFIPIKVTYPKDGVSHFKPLMDNALITWMHTRLFVGMLYRLPVLLFRKTALKRKGNMTHGR